MPSFLQLPINTERLVLRTLRPDDAAELFAIYSDPTVMRFWGTPAWTRIEQAIEMIERESKATQAGEYLRLGIEERESSTLIGACALFSFHEASRRAEMGYILRSQSWGKALMSESLRSLVNYGFTNLNLNRIEADIDPRNERSERVLQRLGFVKEGHLRQRWIVSGEVSDSALYGLLRSDWEART